MVILDPDSLESSVPKLCCESALESSVNQAKFVGLWDFGFPHVSGPANLSER